MSTASKLSEFLRERRRQILRDVELQSPGWSDSYGEHTGSAQTIQVIDFDALCEAIDEFSEQFSGG